MEKKTNKYIKLLDEVSVIKIASQHSKVLYMKNKLHIIYDLNLR